MTLLATACRDDVTPAALATFERFQTALFARDASAARDLVTAESRPVIDAMPWDRIASRPRLTAIEATDERGCFHVAVRDPDAAGALGAYVVVRENGRLCVDLVATAALCAVPGVDTGGPPQLQPRALEPRDLEAIRRHELATPPAAR